jgi:hypothetical protein
MKERCENRVIRIFFTRLRMTAAVEIAFCGTATQHMEEQPLENRAGALSDIVTDTANSGRMVRKSEVDYYLPTGFLDADR